MTHHCARLIVVAIATVSFSTPITAQQEPTSQEVADIRVRAEQGEAEAVAWYRRAARRRLLREAGALFR